MSRTKFSVHTEIVKFLSNYLVDVFYSINPNASVDFDTTRSEQLEFFESSFRTIESMCYTSGLDIWTVIFKCFQYYIQVPPSIKSTQVLMPYEAVVAAFHVVDIATNDENVPVPVLCTRTGVDLKFIKLPFLEAIKYRILTKRDTVAEFTQSVLKTWTLSSPTFTHPGILDMVFARA